VGAGQTIVLSFDALACYFVVLSSASVMYGQWQQLPEESTAALCGVGVGVGVGVGTPGEGTPGEGGTPKVRAAIGCVMFKSMLAAELSGCR
jgi:hypothetical protein